MDVITKSADHHFLTTLARLKSVPQNWVMLTFSLSCHVQHSEVLAQASAVNKYLSTQQDKVYEDLELMRDLCALLHKATLYQFDDLDIVLLAQMKTDESRERIQHIFKVMAARVGEELASFGYLEHDFYGVQKFADQKLLSAKAMRAYYEMGDRHKLASIGARRERRGQPLVQVVEDDRFTASYTANILNREYDMILSRTGEDAILHYIEQAPDIVFIDIHLPGLSGHQVLQALKVIDPKVYAVMLSVDTMKDNIVRSAEGGANNFLKKPFSKERLLNIVKSSPFIQGWMRRSATNAL
jgi:CheY-like chemotaxis protein